MTWMIYGTYGFTGRLIVEEALRRGHRPILAGRDLGKLQRLSDELGLPFRRVDLNNSAALREAIGDCKLVLNTAGPFAKTSAKLIESCLRVGCHYADIAGELSHIRRLQSLDKRARKRGIAILTGAGFGVTFGECLAHLVLA